MDNLVKYCLDDLKGFQSDNRCGVYLLYLDCKVVYVGKSLNVIDRIRFCHTHDKSFNQWSYIPISYTDAGNLEAELVIKYQPVLNQRLPKNNRFLSKDWFRQQAWGKQKEAIFKAISITSPVACIKGSYIYDIKDVIQAYNSV